MLPGRSRPDRGPIMDGQSKNLLKMCTREQLGDDLRRVARDVTCDDNFDASAAPSHHLDFEIVPEESPVLNRHRFIAKMHYALP